MNDLTILQQQALQIAAAYKQKNLADGHKPWDASAYMAGFVGDVGDLNKLVMAKMDYRHYDAVDEKIAHELADCLWSVLVLAHELNVDIEQAYKTMTNELRNRLGIG